MGILKLLQPYLPDQFIAYLWNRRMSMNFRKCMRYPATTGCINALKQGLHGSSTSAQECLSEQWSVVCFIQELIYCAISVIAALCHHLPQRCIWTLQEHPMLHLSFLLHSARMNGIVMYYQNWSCDSNSCGTSSLATQVHCILPAGTADVVLLQRTSTANSWLPKNDFSIRCVYAFVSKL